MSKNMYNYRYTLAHKKKKLILVINTKQVVMFVNLLARSLAQRSGF